VRTVSGNEAEQTRTVVRTNALETFEYDGNGNLTNWVSGAQNWSYEWDWADRLTKVTSNGVVVLENWYDAQSRRIAKAEVVNGQMVKTLYLYDGWDIVGVMNEAGQMRETFARGVGLAGDIGTLVTVTHHAGSWTNGTFYAHHNHRGDVILTRSGTTTVGQYDYTAFGSLKSQTGLDVCRFKFSTEERDNSTGFGYHGYRFYAPQWQRWASTDPIDNGKIQNLYLFVANAPLNAVDPDGMKIIKLIPWAELVTCGACVSCLAVASGTCAAQCAKGYWDDPDETFSDCWAKCITAATSPSECPTFNFTCQAACVACGYISL
jgi:RHS repeat-associated protein